MRVTGVPKQATDLIARRQREWRQSLPPILKMEVLKGKEKTRIKKQFLRSGVEWIWDKPQAISWSYYLPIPGRTADRKPRIKAQRIAEAMQSMPDLIAEYREERRQFRLQEKVEKAQVKERERLIQAASTRLTDMRELVKEFDSLDDSFFDGDSNYYQLMDDKQKNDAQKNDHDNVQVLAKATSQSINQDDNDDDGDNDEDIDNKDDDDIVDTNVDNGNLERRRQKITQWRKIQNRRRMRSEKYAEMLKSKPLLSSELDSIQERLDKSREWEKMDPEDGDYDDGRTWNRRRSEKELAYIQQLANEPNLEKEQEKHSKRRVK